MHRSHAIEGTRPCPRPTWDVKRGPTKNFVPLTFERALAGFQVSLGEGLELPMKPVKPPKTPSKPPLNALELISPNLSPRSQALSTALEVARSAGTYTEQRCKGFCMYITQFKAKTQSHLPKITLVLYHHFIIKLAENLQTKSAVSPRLGPIIPL